MDRDGWSGKLLKYNLIIIHYCGLISVFNHLQNITIIKYKSYRRDKQTKLKEASDL